MLKLENLSIKYNDRVVLEHVDVEFSAGTVSVIQGPSGSGKSSLLNVIGLMQKPNRTCTYFYDGLDVTKYTKVEQADFRLHSIGFVFQQNNLLPEFTAYENISIPRTVCFINDKDDNKVNELLEYVGLSHLRDSYPSRLSGGEEQRIAVARALANDADIILADEPTASLDEKNAQTVLTLLEKLAHELDKTVIIVSHDKQVADIADVVYKIEDKNICVVQTDVTEVEGKMERKDKQVAFAKRQLLGFNRFYTKKRMGDGVLNKTFICITAVIAAMVMIFTNFGAAYVEAQTAFINSISDKSIFVVNDTVGLNTKLSYFDATAINDEALNKIDEISYINKWYPYYEFMSVGYSENKSDVARIVIKDDESVFVDKEYINVDFPSNMQDEFAVAPLYPEEDVSYLLEAKSNEPELDDSVVLTNTLAKKLGMPFEELIGKTIEMDVFVPIKLYSSKGTKARDGDIQEPIDDIEIDIDGRIHKLVTIESKIKGVLSSTYDVQRSFVTDKVFLPYDTLNKILQEHKSISYGKTPRGGFEEKEFKANSIIVFANSYNDAPTIISRLESIGPSFAITHTAADIQTIQDSLDRTKNIMLSITIVFIGIVMLMFGMLYYIKNRSRRKEVGILKAIGLTEGNIMSLIGFEMGQIALKSFIGALFISFILGTVGNGLFSVELFSITASSIVIGLVTSLGVVMVAGMLPMYRASKVDPVDAIRQGIK